MANITDVATLAGVSHQTVSRVLNDEDTVRPQTRARVEAAIEQLHYRPSSVARALRSRKTRAIGLISTGSAQYGPSSVAVAINEAAREADYHVSIASISRPERASILTAVDVLLRQNVEALVLIAIDEVSIAAVSDLQPGVPLITADSSGRGAFPSVSIDQQAGATLATAHLAELGHQRILYVSGPVDALDAKERRRGWMAEVQRRGLPVLPVFEGDWTADSGFEIGGRLARQYLSSNAAFSAIFSGNDQMSLGLLHAFAAAGIRVPQDVSIVGFDDLPEAAHFTPPLTTVRQDFTDLGRRIMRTLLSVLAGQEVAENAQTVPHLIERSSTMAPRGWTH